MTVKVELADVRLTELKGKTGSLKAILIAHGQVTVGVDLSAARLEEVDPRQRTAVLILPQPKVLSVMLDHERTRLLGVWPSGLWTIVPGGREAGPNCPKAAIGC